MQNNYLKSLILVASLSATALVAGCGSPSEYEEVEQMELETQSPDAEAAEDNAEAAVAEAPVEVTDAPPVESVPVDPKTSEESVQPDSETLFY